MEVNVNISKKPLINKSTVYHMYLFIGLIKYYSNYFTSDQAIAKSCYIIENVLGIDMSYFKLHTNTDVNQ
jgi:hypothetical protein